MSAHALAEAHTMFSNVSASGQLNAKVVRAPKASFAWRLRNVARWSFIRGAINVALARLFSWITEIPTLTSELSARLVKADGSVVDFGVLSYRVVTDAGVAYLANDFNNGASSADVSNFNYHGCGVGTTAEAAGDTALVTESTTALNPDSTRATGTRSNPTANSYRSTGTLTFDATAAVTEHGLFSVSGTGSGTLWDRSVFSAINVASGDSIQFQYTVTFNSGS